MSSSATNTNRILSIVVGALCLIGVVLHVQNSNVYSYGSSSSRYSRELLSTSEELVASSHYVEHSTFQDHFEDKSYPHVLYDYSTQSRRRTTVKELNLGKAKELVKQLLDLIYNRYELEVWNRGAYFYMTSNLADVSFSVYKLKMAKKIMMKDSHYLMSYGGSSVTAGHDGQPNSSFPMIADKRLRPIMDELNIDLETDVFAQSANGCIPYGWCYETMGNPDPDFVNWEQSYNCGHDSASFELTARVAGQSKNRGSIWYSASGGFAPTMLPLSNFTPPYCAEEWTVDSVQAPFKPLTHWDPSAADVALERKKLSEFHKNVSCTSKFVSAKYENSLSPGGFNLWGVMTPCPYGLTNAKGEHITSCAPANFEGTARENVPRFFSKEGARYDNPSGRGAGHHPPKAFHMWRGEAIAYIHGLAILDAIYMIEEDLNSNSREQLAIKYTDALETLQGPLPPPQGCANYYCPHRPTCYTDYTPHARPNHYLNELFVGKQTWAGDDGWKAFYHNTNSRDPLYLRIPRGKHDIVLICGSLGESLKHTVITVDLHGGESTSFDYSKYSFDNRPTTTDATVIWKNRRYINNECTEISKLPEGTHILQISRNETIKSNHVNSVIDVITFD